MIAGLIDETVKRYVPPESVEEQWDIPGLETALASDFQLQAPVGEWLKTDPEITDDTLRERLIEAALAQYADKEAQVGPELMRQFERSLMLQTLDQHWRDHLANLDHLRQGIHLRGYAQKNPKQEYKRESFELFSDMLDRIKQDVVKIVLTVQVRTPEDVQAVEEAPPVQQRQVPARRLRRGARRGGRRSAAGRRAVRARRREGRPQRSLPVRLGQEVQAVPRPPGLRLDARSRGVDPPLRCPSATRRPRPTDLLPVPGVALGTAAAKIKNWQRDDVLLVVFDPGTTAAGVFTQNRFCAAPVIVCRRHLARAGPAFARWSSTPATPTPAPARRASPRPRRPAPRSRRCWAARRSRCCRSRPA